MRAFAERWHLQYVGPSAFSWRLMFSKVRPAIPILLPLAWWEASKIRQVWNVIEGQQNGVSVLIFDAYIGGSKGCYRTFLASKTEQNPFRIDALRDYMVQSIGWTILYRVPFPLEVPWATWSMGIQRLEEHLNTLQVGSGLRA